MSPFFQNWKSGFLLFFAEEHRDCGTIIYHLKENRSLALQYYHHIPGKIPVKGGESPEVSSLSAEDSQRRVFKRILLKHNLVSTQDCEKILQLYDRNKANFISQAISQGYLRTPRFFALMAKELNMEYCSYQRLFKNRHESRLYPYSALKKSLVFPLEESKSTLTFATANPFDNEFLDYIRKTFATKYQIRVIIANPFHILTLLDNEYRDIHSLQAVGELAYRFPGDSASKVLTRPQKIFLLSLVGVFAVWSVFHYPSSFIVLFAVINILYFIINPVKLYITIKGFRRGKEIGVTEKELRSIKKEELPLYTIFVPLYKEAETLPHIIRNVARLDYPREKLDVKIILEEADNETIEAAKKLGLFKDTTSQNQGKTEPPEKGFEVVIVPSADIKTKPRACNFALKRATGEFCVIYDAEDNPDPDQLKKAICAFRKLEKDYICLQAKLNYYNATQNILTKWFTLEYHFWFDYYLPGLVRINAPVPLGGTSNHFRTEALRQIGGWDPYNVTEDADLGMRIHRQGLKTAVMDSYTLEEANSKLWNWIRQRSRWEKGYAQTFLVHMRHPLRLLKDTGLRSFLLFQLTFGGNFYLPLLNSLLWLVTILTFVFKGTFSSLFLYPIPIMALFNLVVGNSIYIIVHIYAAIKTRKYFLVPYAILIPFYWILISVGCWKGTIQLITKPFYWEKTIHALYRVEQKT